MTLQETDRVARIRKLNDAFRKTFVGGKMVVSASITALPEMVRASALVKVAEFDGFNPENDPHGSLTPMALPVTRGDHGLEVGAGRVTFDMGRAWAVHYVEPRIAVVRFQFQATFGAGIFVGKPENITKISKLIHIVIGSVRFRPGVPRILYPSILLSSRST